MHIFLTGATGHIGSAALAAMIRGGHRVTAIARDPEKAQRLLAKGTTPVLAELGLAKPYLPLLASADAVVHTAYESSARGVQLDQQTIELMLAAQREAMAADGKPRAFIYTSSVWVLGRTAKAADEGAPLRPPQHVAWRPAHEALVMAAQSFGLRSVVVRPGIVYGGGRGIVGDLIKDALNGIIRVVGPGKNRWSCVNDHDLGDLYVRILDSPAAAGVFHANDEADERVSDIVEAIADQVPQRPDIRNMPMVEARKKLGTYADALALDQTVRSPRARALGWAPSKASVATSVARLLEELRGSKSE